MVCVRFKMVSWKEWPELFAGERKTFECSFGTSKVFVELNVKFLNLDVTSMPTSEKECSTAGIIRTAAAAFYDYET